MFSMGFKSGEFGGQIISDSFTNPRDFKTAGVAFAACDGALSKTEKDLSVEISMGMG